MQRIMVMGCSGSGKSTFGRALADRLAVPFVSLDRLFWLPGWRESERSAFARKATVATEQENWVIDGNYITYGAGLLRRARADTVVWFDLPRRTCLMGVLLRTLRSYGTVRPEMGSGCPERFEWGFLCYVWTYRKLQRPKLLIFFDGLRNDQRLVVFKSRRDADAFLASAGRA